jgi:hypothetical protein
MAGCLRVLLVARSAGEWWVQLTASTDAAVRTLAMSARQTLVRSAVSEVVDGADLVRSAVQAFANALSVPAPDLGQLSVRPGPVPILVLHAAALLAVLNQQGPRYGHVTGPGVAEAPGCRQRVFQVRDDETGRTYSFGYADIVTEGFRSLRSGERVRFLTNPSRPGCATYVISLDLPDVMEYYK